MLRIDSMFRAMGMRKPLHCEEPDGLFHQSFGLEHRVAMSQLVKWIGFETGFYVAV